MRREYFSLLGVTVIASFLGGALATAVLTSRVEAQTKPPATPTVTTEQLNLVNRAGQLRGVLSAEDERGMASLTLFDESGGRRADLSVGRSGVPALQLYDRAQEVRIFVTLDNDQPALVISGDADRRAVLSTPTGSPTLAFQDGNRIRAEIGIDGNGASRIGLFGQTGRQQVNLSLSGQGDPLLILRDGNGRSRASLGVVQDSTVVNLADRNVPRVVLGVAPDGNATLSFLDSGGKVTHRVP